MAMNALFLLAMALVPGQTSPLVCDRPIVDRGQVRGGPPLTERFTLTNRGPDPVHIVEARASCGCLTPTVSARAIPPGQSVTLDLQIGTISQPEGTNRWSVHLVTRTTAGKEFGMDLQVHAQLVREVSLEPSAIRLFGRTGLSHETVLSDRRAEPLTVTAVRSSSKNIQTDAGIWNRVEQGWVRRIRVSLAPDAPLGKFEDVVQIFSSDPDYREVRVTVTGERRDKQRYLVTPAEVRLDVAPGKPAPSYLVLIRDSDGQPMEIEKAAADDPALSVRFAEGTHPTAAVRISVKKEGTPTLQSTVQVQIRSPIPDTVIIPISRK
jgi:hypothetical protein